MFFGLLALMIIKAQVGINTSDPKATLDINGNLKIRTLNTVSSLSANQNILITDKTAGGDFEIKEISANALLGQYNGNAYYASKSGSWSLVDLGIGSSWYRINLTGSQDTKLGTPSLFNAGVYTAPQSGIYMVDYEFQLASGANLEVLGGKRFGIFKNASLWDEKLFDGVRVAINAAPILTLTLAAIPITSTNLSTLVYLNSSETLTFAVNTGGLLPIDLAVLTSGKVNIKIYKVGN